MATSFLKLSVSLWIACLDFLMATTVWSDKMPLYTVSWPPLPIFRSSSNVFIAFFQGLSSWRSFFHQCPCLLIVATTIHGFSWRKKFSNACFSGSYLSPQENCRQNKKHKASTTENSCSNSSSWKIYVFSYIYTLSNVSIKRWHYNSWSDSLLEDLVTWKFFCLGCIHVASGKYMVLWRGIPHVILYLLLPVTLTTPLLMYSFPSAEVC